MASDMLRSYKREMQKLQSELEQNPAFMRWKLLKQLIGTYPDTEQSGQVSATPTDSSPAPANSAPPPVSAPAGRATAIVAAAVDYLRTRGKRATSTEMADDFKAKGIDIPGVQKASTLSAYLSGAKDIFDNVRDQGYGLVEWRAQGGVPVVNGNGARTMPMTTIGDTKVQ